MRKITPLDRTAYCQAHLADVTMTGVRPEEQETTITFKRESNNVVIETSDPNKFNRLIKYSLDKSTDCHLTYVWAPSGYPLNHCTVARFTIPIYTYGDRRPFDTNMRPSTEEREAELTERMSTLQTKLTD